MATGDRLFIADKPTLDSVNTKVGVNTDAGGTTTLFARVRQIFEQLTTMSSTALSRTVWTDARAQRLDSISTAPSSGRATFRANGTFTVPAGVNGIIVTACGAGGNGFSSTGGGGGGGGGACIFSRLFTVTPAQVINITVGSGVATILSGLVTLGNGGNGTGQVGGGGASGGVGGGAGGNQGQPGAPGLCASGGAGVGSWGGGGGSFGGGGSANIDIGGGTVTSISLNGGVGGVSTSGIGGRGSFGGGGGSFGTGGLGGSGIVIIEW